MRQELDAKVLYSGSDVRLNNALGKDFMTRFKFYIKKFYEKDEQQAYDSQTSQPESVNPLAKLVQIAEQAGRSNKKAQPKHQMMAGGPQLPVEEYSETAGVYLPNIIRLKQREAEVQIRYPLLLFKTRDDLVQLKCYILTYYKPIISQFDIEQFENDIEADLERQLQ